MHSLATPPVNPDLRALYARETANGHLNADPVQEEAVRRMDEVHQDWLQEGRAAPAGIYLWGDVGRGKSRLMDMLFQASTLQPKHRVHFHRFMQDVHKRIHAARGAGKNTRQPLHPVENVARKLAPHYRLLCLDELQVTDVADAMILSRLFTILLEEGVHIVFTSNRPPEELYTGGLQREGFVPFIALVQERMAVQHLAGRHDYRLQQLQSLRKTYVSPHAEPFVEEAIRTFGGGEPPAPLHLRVQGREVAVHALGDETAIAGFDELCARALGAADYLAIAERFHTLILTRIPMLTPEKRNEARRFVTLIDVLYDHKVKLIATAAAPPDALYPEGDGSFEFARTASRLVEMQSEAYLTAARVV